MSVKREQCRVCQKGDRYTCLACALDWWEVDLTDRHVLKEKQRYKKFLEVKYKDYKEEE